MNSNLPTEMSLSLTELFRNYSEQPNPPIIELQNIEHKPIGALYFKTLRYNNLVISSTTNSEKYYLYIDGIGIYFSFYRKLSNIDC